MHSESYGSYPRLKEKVVFITGASAGIGEASARQFAASGAKLVITARRVEKLHELKKELEDAFSTKIHAIGLDVRSNEAVVAAVQALPAEFAAVDVLVNNAGCSLGMDKVADITAEQIDTVVDTNVKGLLFVTRAILPGMLARNSGMIINIGSIAGQEAYPGGSIYCATKFAVNAITESLRKELVATPLRVCQICPGLVETEFSIVRFGGNRETAKLPYKGIVPLIAEDIADTVVYAASRPAHVQIGDITLTPANQAKVCSIHKTT
eukprot:TRINITY_DN5173_c0_g1_i1.p1 TRINITY_DN5173_c0_g1~~TRINITY_DN5173_c0_g1_i1.p1  ORF type:complete len:266 (+),score=93.20 TRINITY_DN5173_c0_g1_i1:917-1714(+)